MLHQRSDTGSFAVPQRLRKLEKTNTRDPLLPRLKRTSPGVRPAIYKYRVAPCPTPFVTPAWQPKQQQAPRTQHISRTPLSLRRGADVAGGSGAASTELPCHGRGTPMATELALVVLELLLYGLLLADGV